VDCHLHALLVETAALHAKALAPATDTWHGGRFLERWAREDVVRALWDSLVRDENDVADAIRRTVDLFDRLADELPLPIAVRRDEARRRLEALLA
jgi:hypothetical protein